ncbi:SAM-dependent methyltransferase [Actinoplanes rectilineatus]|uniref:SAM-dependent methyltransferase n=1 Tax=Actinoplanes rectilineatus TaxID=113571 RepID=UPI0005F2B4F8|nr:SAM-dependent methyltransferase [Actinoplanes rectilineatus]
MDSSIDSMVAHPARRYDYWLGGKDNFEADRASAREIEKRMPTIRVAVHENRWFLHRAVRHLAGLGIRQFLDIGSGIPTSPNTHEVAQQGAPSSHVVYVDNDPMVLTHARALLASDPRGRTAYLQADLRDPASILADPELRATLDLNQPVALLLIAVVHFLRDADDPRAIVAALVDALPPGSFVVASHGTDEYMPAEQSAALRAVADAQSQIRTGTEFAEIFQHPRLELLAPGVQSVASWWPEQAPQPRPPVDQVAFNALLARVK